MYEKIVFNNYEGEGKGRRYILKKLICDLLKTERKKGI